MEQRNIKLIFENEGDSMKIDLIIKGAKVFNSYFKNFFQEDIAVLNGKIFYVGQISEKDFSCEKIVNAQGKYVIPGLIDIHMHIESSMATPLAFSHELVKNGVTTIVSEPHEMANVFGIDGIKEMIKLGEDAEIDIYYGVPSSVPSTSIEYETTGGEIDLNEINELMKNEKVICLGEVMNYYDVINSSDKKINKILKYYTENHANIPIEGHCPRLMGLELSKFVWAGVTSDHTQQTVEGIEARIKNGMFIEIQEKSMTQPIIDYLIKNNLYEHFSFVTDDVMADSFVNEGHINKLVRKAVAMGMSIENAVYCSTYTPARRMNLNDRGSISTGKIADFLLLDDSNIFKIHEVYKNGKEIFNSDKEYNEFKSNKTFSPHFYNSIKLKHIDESKLKIKANINNGKALCRIMKIEDGSTFTDEIFEYVNVKEGYLQWENSPFCLIAVFERHGKNGNIGYGLATGDTIKKGAVAASYAHDHHNILVVGKNSSDIVKAVNSVIDSQGGYYVVENNKILAGMELSVGGILSEKDMPSIGKELSEVKAAMKYIGYKHYSPIMSFSTNGLPVSPLLKITDKGLIKLSENKIVDIFVEV